MSIIGRAEQVSVLSSVHSHILTFPVVLSLTLIGAASFGV